MDLKIEYVGTDTINPYKNNAKLHPKEQVEQIKKSIKDYGMNDPIAVWHDEIVEGHGRLMACKELGIDTVPIIRLDDLTDDQRREYMLVHNKTTMNSDFDIGLLDLELGELSDFDAEFYDFDIGGVDDPEEIVEDEIPEEPEQPISQPGELYELGRHRLMCGDATDPDVIKTLLGGIQADLLVTDPPYNVNYEGATKDKLKIMNDHMDDSSFRTFLCEAFMAAKVNMKPGAAFYIWHADSEGYNFRGACKDVEWTVRECLIWKKNAMVLGRQDYQWQHEPCLYGWNDGSHAWYSDRKQTTIMEFNRPTVNKEHPTMKPVALFDYLIQNSSKKGDAVLDTFGGSGTTIIACEQDGRCGYSTELDPKYCDVIINRYINLKGSDEDVYLIKDGEKIPWHELSDSRS